MRERPRLRPFFPYYGGKHRLAPRYPTPRLPVIVEPFAGAAGFSVLHYSHQVRLFDANPCVAGVWDYLIRVRPAELLALPSHVRHIEELRSEPQEARWLVGFWLNTAQTYPSNAPSTWAKSGRWPGKFWGERVRTMLARQVRFIRHWRVECRSYETLPDIEATWFVDPPYSGPAGAHYRRWRLQGPQFPKLAGWCRARRGQVIVCENAGARWLPFRFLADAAAFQGRSAEAVWTNDGSDRPQTSLWDDVAVGGVR